MGILRRSNIPYPFMFLKLDQSLATVHYLIREAFVLPTYPTNLPTELSTYHPTHSPTTLCTYHIPPPSMGYLPISGFHPMLFHIHILLPSYANSFSIRTWLGWTRSYASDFRNAHEMTHSNIRPILIRIDLNIT